MDVAAGDEERKAIEMTATGCAELTFRVELDAASDPAFSLDGDTMTYDPAGAGVVSGVQVRYTAGAAGSSASGTARIRLERSSLEWEVALTANAARATAAAITLVADTSGSMALLSGVATKTRMDVLKESLVTAIDTLLQGTACALVRFDSDAHLAETLTAINTPDIADGGRVALRRGGSAGCRRHLDRRRCRLAARYRVAISRAPGVSFSRMVTRTPRSSSRT
jgi:hypothetical protein